MRIQIYRFLMVFSISIIWVALVSYPAVALADPDIKIFGAEGQFSNNILSITVDAKVDLARDPTEALESGVPLFFDLNIEILRNRTYMWDRDLFKTKYTYSLQRHTLSKKYVLKNLITDTQQAYSSITEALYNLGQIKKLAVIDLGELTETKNLVIAIQFELKISALPVPIMPLAYISPQWHISSDRYKWELDL
jgi:hypothetical protein